MNIRRFSPSTAEGDWPTRRLEAHAVRSYDARGAGALRCLSGRCWITRTGDPRDYLLTAGEECLVSGSEHLVVQALDTASLAFSGALVERNADPSTTEARKRYAAPVPAVNAGLLSLSQALAVLTWRRGDPKG